jgi:hypothetical protein
MPRFAGIGVYVSTDGNGSAIWRSDADHDRSREHIYAVTPMAITMVCATGKLREAARHRIIHVRFLYPGQ